MTSLLKPQGPSAVIYLLQNPIRPNPSQTVQLNRNQILKHDPAGAIRIQVTKCMCTCMHIHTHTKVKFLTSKHTFQTFSKAKGIPLFLPLLCSK